ncbi:MAG: hypothetical protein Q7J26_01925 [Brevundimonas sp.]|uniref:hypothetical protein n=1 Tax=Brevundimonas sp. TaxID=1871086 RepID=UPI00271756F4|nr:hypothetical protein [Brevundimonas sp.]MDO9607256.1 hypothetical protein [Brevundimonas sp.]
MAAISLSTPELLIIEAALRNRVSGLQIAASEAMRRGDRHGASLASQGAGAVQRLQKRLETEVF